MIDLDENPVFSCDGDEFANNSSQRTRIDPYGGAFEQRSGDHIYVYIRSGEDFEDIDLFVWNWRGFAREPDVAHGPVGIEHIVIFTGAWPHKTIGSDQWLRHQFFSVAPLPHYLPQGYICFNAFLIEEFSQHLLVSRLGIYRIPGFFVDHSDLECWSAKVWNFTGLLGYWVTG